MTSASSTFGCSSFKKGVPVTGGELVVHLRGARAVAANGHTIADFPEDVTARIWPDLAKAKALPSSCPRDREPRRMDRERDLGPGAVGRATRGGALVPAQGPLPSSERGTHRRRENRAVVVVEAYRGFRTQQRDRRAGRRSVGRAAGALPDARPGQPAAA